MERYSYFVWTLFFFFIWFPFFVFRPDLRKQSLVIGSIVAIMTPMVGWWYLQDYWNPVFYFEINLFGGLRTGIEEIFLGFFIGSISSVIYEAVFSKKLVKQKKPLFWGFPFLFMGMLYLLAAFLVLRFNINSIYASFITFIFGFIVFGVIRKDLIWPGIVAGVLFSAIIFSSYVLWLELLFPGTIESWWFISSLSQVTLLGVPIEEIGWGFLWGSIGGMFYKAWQGLVLVEQKRG